MRIIDAASAGVAALSSKMGLVCTFCELKHYNPLTELVNWTHNYRLAPHDKFPMDWANSNGVEWVSMIQYQHLLELEDGKTCQMFNDFAHNFCDPEEIAGVLKKVKSQFNGNLKYLLGWNEPYH